MITLWDLEDTHTERKRKKNSILIHRSISGMQIKRKQKRHHFLNRLWTH